MSRRLIVIALSLLAVLALAACGGGEPPAAKPTAVAGGGQTAEATAPPTEPPATEPAATESPTQPAPEPTATAVASPTPAILCPDLPRPALIVGNGPAFDAVDAATGARCPLALPDTAAYLQAAENAVYFLLSDQDAGSSAIHRLGATGLAAPLESTRVTNDVHYLLRLAVSGDESRLAWSHMRTPDDPNATGLLGSLWIGDGQGGAPVAIFEDELGGQFHIVSPIRFSADGQTLFFSWEPIGLGGAWSAFNGRYDNLYRVPAAGGAPQKVFDCADLGLFLCLGDFREDGTLAYIDAQNAIHVNGPDGAELAAIPTAADYAGYPTFSPGGDLYYSVAELIENTASLPLPEPGTIYRVTAPYTAAPAVVASANGLLLSAMRDVFLDADRVLVSASEAEEWGMGVMDAAGAVTRLEPWPNAYPAAIWR